MMNNRQLADTFTLIGNLLEIKGEFIYITLAYVKASESLMGLGREASEYWKEGKLEDIPGVGKAIAEKIDELLNTGKLQFLEKLKKEVPEELAGWLAVPGLGPKKIAMIWKELDITALSDLETAAKDGKLRDMPGMGAKSESAILEGIASLARRSGRIQVGRAYPLAQEIIKTLKGVKGVVDAESAGS
jgi:DNA polymerase (family 10)